MWRDDPDSRVNSWEINSRESGSVPHLLPTPRSSLSFVARTGSREREWNNERDTCRGSEWERKIESGGPVLLTDSQWTCCSAVELSPPLVFGWWLLVAVRMLSSTDAHPQSAVVPVLGCWRPARGQAVRQHSISDGKWKKPLGQRRTSRTHG